MDRNELDTLSQLLDRLNQAAPTLSRQAAYYEGQQRLETLGLSLPPEMRRLHTVVNWCATYVNAIARRQKVEGFRLASSDGGDARFWDWWQANNLDEESDLAHLEALVQGRCYIVVGYDPDEPGTPTITVESPTNTYAEIDRRTRKVTSAVQAYSPDEGGQPTEAVLHFPNYWVEVARDRRGGWVEVDRVHHQLGVVPVVPMVNRNRITDVYGRTEMADVMGLTDAACRTLTNLQGAQELMAVPQRYILGASEDLFQDANGDPVPAWQAYVANILTVPSDGTGEKIQVGQFSAAELHNYTGVIESYAKLVSTVTGLPSHYLGMSTENPASADAIRSSEARLVKLVERKNASFEAAWEQAMRIGARLVDGAENPQLRRLETVWRDPSTPTLAEKADAIRKLFGSNEPLIDRQTALEMMQYGPEEVRKILDRLSNDPVNQLLAMVSDGPSDVQRPAEVDQ